MSRLLAPAAFRAEVRRFVRERCLAHDGQPILVACSGGADSVALLHLLHSLGHPVAAAHVNYGLRGADAQADARLVEELAEQLGIPCAVHAESPRELALAEGLSLQVAARRIRYRFFRNELNRLGWTRLATAHHRGDQAETLLLSLLRGQSVEVLRGIPVRRGPVIRPLLFAPKAQLIHYLEAEGLTWREDRSNASSAYLRNRIRHQVLPALAAINPRIEEHLVERGMDYAEQFRALTGGRNPAGLLAGTVLPSAPDFIAVDAHKLQSNHPDRSLFYILLQDFLEKEYKLRPADAHRVARLVGAQTGSRIETARGWWWRTTDGLRRTPSENRSGSKATVAFVSVLERTSGSSWVLVAERVGVGCGEVSFSVRPRDRVQLPPPLGTAFLDVERLVGPLVLRPWQAGDRFEPLGLGGSRLVSDELTNAKYPAHLRKQARVLADHAGPVWIETGRIARRIALTERTAWVLVVARIEDAG